MSLFDLLCNSHWAMDPGYFDQMRAIVERHADGVKLTRAELESAIGRAPSTPHPRNRKYEIAQGVALIPVQGVISKHAADTEDISAPKGTSAEQIQENIRTALGDRDVQAILLHIESPGGQVDGTRATADLIRRASADKPTWALIDGLGASAAYWMASACTRILATADSQVGSIGVVAAIRDTSKAMEKAGMRTVVVRSGPFKATPQAGEAVTDEMLKPLQELVAGFAQSFFSAVSVARGLTGEALAKVTDGRCFLSAQAQSLGLIDGIDTLEGAIAAISDPLKRGLKPVQPAMSASTSPTRGRDLPAPALSPLAGGRPAAKGQSMNIDPELAALLAAHPNHTAKILAMASGGPDKSPATKDAIVSAIKDDELSTLRAKLTETSGELAKAKADVTAAEVKRTTEVTALESQIATLKASVVEKDKALENYAKGHKGGLDGISPPNPSAHDPVAAYQARVEALRKDGVKDPYRQIANKEPDLHKAYLAAANKGGG